MYDSIPFASTWLKHNYSFIGALHVETNSELKIIFETIFYVQVLINRRLECVSVDLATMTNEFNELRSY